MTRHENWVTGDRSMKSLVPHPVEHRYTWNTTTTYSSDSRVTATYSSDRDDATGLTLQQVVCILGLRAAEYNM